MPVSILNLDDSFPIADDFHSANITGVIRFIDADDANRLEGMQRLQGDLVNRFLLHQAKINELVLAVNATPGLVDNASFVMIDGSHPFTAPQSGVTPTISSHLATKGYVDAGDAAQSQNLANVLLSIAQINAKLPIIHASQWQTHVWSAGVGAKVTFTITPGDVDLNNLLLIKLLEKVNINTIDNPEWVYRTCAFGGAFGVDDLVIRGKSASQVEVYIPHKSYVPNYGDASFLNVVERQLKIVVITGEACDLAGSSSSSQSSSSSSSSQSESSSSS